MPDLQRTALAPYNSITLNVAPGVQMCRGHIKPMALDVMRSEVSEPDMLFKQVLRAKAADFKYAADLQLSSRESVFWQPQIEDVAITPFYIQSVGTGPRPAPGQGCLPQLQR